MIQDVTMRKPRLFRLTLIGAMLNLTTPLLAEPARAGPEAVGESEVKGVNPADILNRADAIIKVINLEDGESVIGTLKYDKKLGNGFGANFEFPVAAYINVGQANAFGVGDFFSRLRYVRPLSKKVFGLLSLELVAPTASSPLLGLGKWQINPAAGLVYMWSQRTFTTGLYKHAFSVAGDPARPDLSVNQVRGLQTVILDRGYYVTLDVRHEWQTRGLVESWTTTDLEVGRQFSARWAGSIRIGKGFGDRRNAGTLELNVRTFF
jgi:hypothetical protein